MLYRACACRAHKEVLFFASPFFEAALSGDWAETGRPQSMSSVITISQPPTVPRADSSLPRPTSEATLEQVQSDPEPEQEQDQEQDECESDARPEPEASDSEAETSTATEEQKEKARMESLSKLESPTAEKFASTSESKGKQRALELPPLRRRTRRRGPDAVIVLKEEKVRTSYGHHDASIERKLCRQAPSTTSSNMYTLSAWYYGSQLPRKLTLISLVCTITWNNVEGLMNISHKLTVPALQRECLTFLLTHAAGKPIKAMRIAELFEEEELYRESSRFVLDNPGGWTEQELSTLSPETLLKLEKRYEST